MSAVVFLSHTHVGGPFRVGSHHYAEQFARMGDQVVHVSTPVSRLHRLRGLSADKVAAVNAGTQTTGAGLMTLTPTRPVPLQVVPFVEGPELIARLLHGTADVVFIDQPLMAVPSLRRATRRLIYRPTDLYLHGVAAKRQRALLAYVDGVVATSEAVLSDLRLPKGLPSLVLNNGVEFDRFSTRAEQVERSGVVYVGAFDHRFDWSVVIHLAELFPSETFRLIGPLTDAPVLPANIVLVGAVAYADVPAALRESRVGLLPLSDSPENRGRSPMKLYEYLASGLQVVTRETPTLRQAEEQGVWTYRGLSDAAAALSAALDGPLPNLAGTRIAALRDWSSRAAELRAFIEALPAA